MRTLVVYASKHGATRGIAERIAAKLTEAGLQAEARQAAAAGNLADWDAFVIGSAVYAAHWQKGASHFVQHILLRIDYVRVRSGQHPRLANRRRVAGVQHHQPHGTAAQQLDQPRDPGKQAGVALQQRPAGH